jgi:hypothetical protein
MYGLPAHARDSPDQGELAGLYHMLCRVVQWVDKDREDRQEAGGSAATAADDGPKIARDSFHRAMDHLGLTLSKEETAKMFNHADEWSDTQQGEPRRPNSKDGELQLEEFLWETADAQRDIHDNDHPRSPQQLWRLVYERLKLVDQARRMRRKVLRLGQLFGIEHAIPPAGGARGVVGGGVEPIADTEERFAIAAQLIYDTSTRRNIYHKLSKGGRDMYLRLHRWRHIFIVAVWVNLLVGWMEDDGHDTFELAPALHTDGELYWVIPLLELCLVPVHLYHCYLRIAVSVRWQNDWWLICKCTACVLIACDAVHEMGAGKNTLPMSRLLRPYLVLDCHSGVRHLHAQCVKALKALKELMVLMLVCLLFFVLAGLMMYPTPGGAVKEEVAGQGHVRGTSQGDVVFQDMWYRVAQLVYLTFGAVNYPDVMLPAYIEDGSMSLLYFLPAIVIFLFLFLNVVLAVVYSGYTEDRNQLIVEDGAKRCVALTLAFTVVAGREKHIDRHTFDALLTAIRTLETKYGTYDIQGGYDRSSDKARIWRDMLWRELGPVKTQHDDERIGPLQFLRLPDMISTGQFRDGPSWALRGAQCHMRQVLREDCRKVTGADPNDCKELMDEVDKGHYHRLRQLPAFGSPHDVKEGDRIVVIRVRGKMGGEKILTQKLSKFRTIDQRSDTVLSSSGSLRQLGSSESMASQAEQGSVVAATNPIVLSRSTCNEDPGSQTAAPPQSSRSQRSRKSMKLARKSTSTTIEDDTSSAIWIGGIPAMVDADQIANIFEQYGIVQNTTLRAKRHSNGSWAFLKFNDDVSVRRAVIAAESLEGVIVTTEQGDARLKVEPMSADFLRRHSTSASRAAWRATVAPTEFKLDWTSGIPLMWRRQEDIHHEQEYVRFAGVVERMNSNGTLSVTCQFDADHQNRIPWTRLDWDNDGVSLSLCRRCLYGGFFFNLRATLLSPLVNLLIGAMIVASFLMSFFQYAYRTENIAEGTNDAWHFAADITFCCFFNTEMILKVLAFGLSGYLASSWHRFDGLISVCTLISTLSLLLPEGRQNTPSHRHWEVLKLMRALRVFRLLRLLSAFALRRDALDKYHLIFSVTSHAGAAMVNFIIYIIAVFSVFTVLGIGMFGGERGLTRGQSKLCTAAQDMPNFLLKDTGYGQATYISVGRCSDDDADNSTWGDAENVVHSYYYGVNFDTVPSSFVTLLHMLIMNNWHLTHEACVKVFEANAVLCSGEEERGGYALSEGWLRSACESLHTKWVVSAYFFTFEFYVALILMNILMSFFLDVYGFVWGNYTAQFKQAKQKEARPIHRVIDHLEHLTGHENVAGWGQADDVLVEPLSSHDVGANQVGNAGGAELASQAGRERSPPPRACMPFSNRKCANCLLREPHVKAVRNIYVPLFIPTYASFATIAGFDAVNMCEACRRYWWAIEMLTCRHGIIGSRPHATIEEAMAADEIATQRTAMELQARIMLKTEAVPQDELGIPVVPVSKT